MGTLSSLRSVISKVSNDVEEFLLQTIQASKFLRDPHPIRQAHKVLRVVKMLNLKLQTTLLNHRENQSQDQRCSIKSCRPLIS
jgi:hypothetical protein